MRVGPLPSSTCNSWECRDDKMCSRAVLALCSLARQRHSERKATPNERSDQMCVSGDWRIKQGSARNILLTKHYAIKMPRLVEWRLFLYGLLANMQEAQFWRYLHSDKLCPVLWSLPGGLLLVMPRAAAFSREDHAALDFDAFVDAGTWVVPVEDKQDSFGWYCGRIVAIDYGS